jgi:uncharacterized protein (DUF1800 family)
MRCVRGPLAALMCLSLLTPSTSGWAAPVNPSPARPADSAPLNGDTRIFHALNRFTFGPRPGDVEAVRSIGLDRWFDQQLHPVTINESALQARLAQFPAMQWSAEDLLFRLPSNAIIRQAIDGKAPVPERGALHAVYENQIYRVAAKKQEKDQNKQQVDGANKGSAAPAMNMDAKAAAIPTNPAGNPHPAGRSTTESASQSGQMNTMSTDNAVKTIDPSLVTAVLALPPQPRVARLASMQQPQLDDFFKSLKGPQRNALTADLSPELKESVGALENPQRLVVDELMAQRLTRDIYSNAQLQEVMTDFWFNHFNVFLHKNEATPYYLVGYERDVIRPRALGKFEDLLEATAHSPAMLEYLDNASSTGPDSPAAEKAKRAASRQPANKRKAPEGLNENYARELMELHTLGVNGGYTQADVIQAARILTGWTVDRPQRGGGFKFDPNRHEPGPKKVLGKNFKENGEREGRDLLHMLATRPATAQFLSRKLAVRFVSDDPPQSLVNRMARSYLKSGGDIAVVLKTMFHSPEFWSPAVYRAKVKTPLEYVVSAARAGNADLANLQPLTNALREMGMPLYGAIPPTGYKWDAADWVSTGALVNRMNFALSLAANRLPGITTTWSTQPDVSIAMPRPVEAGDPQSPISNPQTEESRLETLLVAGGVSDSTRSAVLQQFAAQSMQIEPGQNPRPPDQQRGSAVPVSTSPRPANHAPPAVPLDKQDQLLAGLLLGSPEFQRR